MFFLKTHKYSQLIEIEVQKKVGSEPRVPDPTIDQRSFYLRFKACQ